ncbi:hypothetical protein IMZ48_47040 [Candidatus Bathyarchaeota archaeon]|nr:hypothetical protein [Candidatus Bathyarchaeota archaeon]
MTGDLFSGCCRAMPLSGVSQELSRPQAQGTAPGTKYEVRRASGSRGGRWLMKG